MLVELDARLVCIDVNDMCRVWYVVLEMMFVSSWFLVFIWNTDRVVMMNLRLSVEGDSLWHPVDYKLEYIFFI